MVVENGFTRRCTIFCPKLVAENQRDWAKILPMCIFAYNVSRSEATGYTPYYLMFGREAICPLDIMLKTPNGDAHSNMTDFVSALQQRFGEAFDCGLRQQKTRTERMKQAYDAKVTVRRFSVNQFVWYYPMTPVGVRLSGNGSIRVHTVWRKSSMTLFISSVGLPVQDLS